MKQTEIGMIPDDWEVKRLGDVANNFTGLTYSPENTKEFGTLVLRSSNIQNGMLSFGDNVYVNMDVPERAIAHTGDILICVRNGSKALIGKSALITESANNCAFGAFMTILRTEILNQHFLFYLWQSDLIQKQIQESMGATINQITNKDINHYFIAYPKSKFEQKKIAQVLSDVDSVISTLEKLIAKKKNIKQGTMQQLLTGKKRLPGFAKSDKFKQTEIGLIPIDLEVRELGEVFSFLPNNTLSRDCLNYDEGKYQDIHYGDVLINFPSVLDCQKAEIPFINNGHKVNFDKYGVKEGDIIIADTAEDETCGKVTEIYNLGDKKLVSGLHTILCRPKTDDFAPKWLGYFMNYSMYHNQLIPLMSGIKVSSVSKSSIMSTKVAFPQKPEQTAIANVFSDMDREIEALEAKLGKYKNLKTGMMQQLLTGRIRLG